jgi:hypothetical protein
MRIEIPTKTPKPLLQKIYVAIKEGSIRTWAMDSEGDLTHTAPRWKGRAWLRPRVVGDGLIFDVIGYENQTPTLEEKAYYVGHFTETMITHFSGDFPHITTVV